MIKYKEHPDDTEEDKIKANVDADRHLLETFGGVDDKFLQNKAVTKTIDVKVKFPLSPK